MRLSAPSRCPGCPRAGRRGRAPSGRRLRPTPRGGRTTPRGPPGGCSGRGTSSHRLALRPARGAFSSWRRRAVVSRVLEGGDAGERLAFEELEGGTAARGDVGELVLEPGYGRGRIPAAHDRRGAALPRLDQRFPDGAGPLVERRRLEHTHGAVPEDGLGLQDPGAEVEPSGVIDIEDGTVRGDAIARDLLPFGGARATRRHDGPPWGAALGSRRFSPRSSPLRAPRRTVAWAGRAPRRGSGALVPSENR